MLCPSVSEKYSGGKDTTFILIKLEDSYIRNIKRNQNLIQTGLTADSIAHTCLTSIQSKLQALLGKFYSLKSFNLSCVMKLSTVDENYYLYSGT